MSPPPVSDRTGRGAQPFSTRRGRGGGLRLRWPSRPWARDELDRAGTASPRPRWGRRTFLPPPPTAASVIVVLPSLLFSAASASSGYSSDASPAPREETSHQWANAAGLVGFAAFLLATGEALAAGDGVRASCCARIAAAALFKVVLLPSLPTPAVASAVGSGAFSSGPSPAPRVRTEEHAGADDILCNASCAALCAALAIFGIYLLLMASAPGAACGFVCWSVALYGIVLVMLVDPVLLLGLLFWILLFFSLLLLLFCVPIFCGEVEGGRGDTSSSGSGGLSREGGTGGTSSSGGRRRLREGGTGERNPSAGTGLWREGRAGGAASRGRRPPRQGGAWRTGSSGGTSRGLSREEVEALPVKTFVARRPPAAPPRPSVSDDVDEDAEAAVEEEADDSCRICLEPYVAGDELRVLPCRHDFHGGCVDAWLVDRASCPTCRRGARDALDAPSALVGHANLGAHAGGSVPSTAADGRSNAEGVGAGEIILASGRRLIFTQFSHARGYGSVSQEVYWDANMVEVGESGGPNPGWPEIV